MMKKLTILTFFLVSAIWLRATTYYVVSTGSNAANGLTTGTAWQTLAYASTHTSSGDVIHVMTGTLLETVQVAIPVGVSIEGDGITSIIQSTYDDGSGFNLGAGITLISGSNTNGNQHISNVLFDGRSLAQDLCIDVRMRNNVEIYNCTFQNFFQAGVIITGQQDNSHFSAPAVYATGIAFHDNIMNNCARCDGATMFGCFMWGGTDGALIYNNTITQNQRSSQTNGEPIKGWCDSYVYNTYIYNNTLVTQPTPAGKANGDDGHWDFAIELFYSYGGNQIYSNTMTGSIDANWQLNYFGTYSWYIHDNLIGFSTFKVGRQSGIIMEFTSERLRIERNIIRNCCDGIIFSMRSGNRLGNINVSNNLLYNVGSAAGGYGTGIGYFASGIYYSIDTLTINHNTIVATTNTSFAPFYGIQFGDATSINLFTFTNNIVQGFQDGSLVTNTPSAWSNSVVSYSDFYLNAHSNALFTTFAGTNTPSGCALSNNLLGTNPSFTNFGTYDFTLAGGSALINAGSDGTDIGYTGGAPTALYRDKVIIKRKHRN